MHWDVFIYLAPERALQTLPRRQLLSLVGVWSNLGL